ncbi:universal stress protein [Leptothermofonsia sichuanensis E412]|uniref:universal stress protein n=1 Tax=Leptothermofonsia sichuanensis TaxID=2917832 RepID=UPI001CA77E35|nr:universal stress protein [Leptothermofonsia sichuanensis]QZZ20816.1 universal stress protein [Leptothermofonsia sichuanensis E412]
MFQKILVALDRSPVNESVFEEALSLAKVTDAALMLLHVLSPMEEGYPMPVYPGPDSVYPGNEDAIRLYAQQWQDFEQKSLEMLRQLNGKALAAGIMTEFSQNVGDPGRVICGLAQAWGADLIVLGRRGHSGLSELILGSVSNYVLHHAPCSVLALQGKVFSDVGAT